MIKNWIQKIDLKKINKRKKKSNNNVKPKSNEKVP